MGAKCSIGPQVLQCCKQTMSTFVWLSVRSFVDALLQQLPRLASSLETGKAGNGSGGPGAAAEARGVFLRLLSQLLALASSRVLSPAGPAHKMILQSYIKILELRCSKHHPRRGI